MLALQVFNDFGMKDLSVEVNSVGCPKDENINLKGVTFETGSNRLTAQSLPILDEAAKTLTRYPDLKIEVSGYTDNVGNADKNKTLSQSRADAVREYLVNKGVKASLTANGYGQEKPIADNGTAEGRAQNRRVELKIQE